MKRSPWIRRSARGIAALGALLAAGAQAQTLDFGSCVRIEDQGARLACYDRAAGRQPAPLAATPRQAAPPQAAPAPPPPRVPADPVAGFGAGTGVPDPLTAPTQKPQAPPEVKQIEARVTAVRKRPTGEQVLTLDNGQVWQQTEVSQQPQYSSGDMVVIRRGLLGSFLLAPSKGGASSRARRIS